MLFGTTWEFRPGNSEEAIQRKLALTVDGKTVRYEGPNFNKDQAAVEAVLKRLMDGTSSNTARIHVIYTDEEPREDAGDGKR